MRPWFVFVILLAALAVLLAFREVRISTRLHAMQAEKQGSATKLEATSGRVQALEAQLESLRNQPVIPAAGPAVSGAATRDTQARVAALEAEVRRLQGAQAGQSRRSAVPEYNPLQPPPPDTDAATETNASPKRSWGPEQATGFPDTDRAGDYQSAWASREPDAGPEWLAVGFDRAVELAEVRVRESYNPGAISRVAALVNGQEVVLWEGSAAGGPAPRDFVLPVTASVQAQSIVIHLDTTQVAGWNEIDAVEIVGRDGSRQWATSATASSTYADRVASLGTRFLQLEQ
jgi:hypothetical protein